MEAFKMKAGSTLVLLLFVGCATVQTSQEWGRLQVSGQERTGHELIWEQSEEEQAAIGKKVDELLADGLSRPEAVGIALFNNRLLQSRFEEIGISKSDLVQAGLFTNPSLEALFRFPSGGGRTNVEAGVFFSLSDFWQVPYRKKVAAARMEATIMEVEQMVLDVAAEAKRAYDAVYYLSKSKKETREILKRFREISDRVVLRRDFGFTSEQDIYLTRIMTVEAEMELARFESESAIARAHLNRVLSLGPSQRDYQITKEESEEPRDIPHLEETVAYALENRLDTQMARFKIRQAERSLKLEKARILGHVGIGASYEGDTEGTDLFGPGLDIRLPLFDQNQARITRAEYKVRQAKKSLQALEGKVREELSRDLERILLLQTRGQQFREKLIPLREKTLAYAEQWVKAMQVNRLYLLEAQKGLLQTRREYLQTLMDLQHAVVDLERHMGGKLP